MRPLRHPAAEEITVEGILYALSDPVRVQILMEIAGAKDHRTCSAFLELDGRRLPKSTLSHHFRVLREAGLIRSEKVGVELHNTSRCAELKQRFGPMIEGILKAYGRQAETRRNPASAKASRR